MQKNLAQRCLSGSVIVVFKRLRPVVLLIVALLISACGTNGGAASGAPGATATSTAQDSATVTTFGASSTPTRTGTQATTGNPTDPTHGWATVMMVYRNPNTPGPEKNLVMGPVDYRTGKSSILTNFGLPEPWAFDEVSPDGKKVIYRTHLDNSVYLLSSPDSPDGKLFFRQPTSQYAEDALWMPDSRNVLVMASEQGVWQVDSDTGKGQQVLDLPFGGVDGLQKLDFYSNGYLYFTGAGGGKCMGALCRVNLAGDHNKVDILSSRQTGGIFWMSPDGQHVYYRNTGPAGDEGIYIVNADGSNSSLYSPGQVGTDQDKYIVGFAADNSLIVMRKAGAKYQLLKLVSNTDQQIVLVQDAAPGAASLCEEADGAICEANINVAPYGHAVMVEGKMKDGTHQIWSTNLLTGKQIKVPVYATNKTAVLLLGWSTLPVK